jgi:AbrB family looped-hinge helix DNA binding protein
LAGRRRPLYDYAIDTIIVKRNAGDEMNEVTVSPKYQVVIPRDVREALGITAGQKLRAIALNGRIELVPVKPARALRGFLRGIDTSVKRDKDRL